MKVKELINKLLEFDMNDEILVQEECGGNYLARPALTLEQVWYREWDFGRNGDKLPNYSTVHQIKISNDIKAVLID